jgi:phosphatidylglycerol lysyltransferase
MAPTEPSLASAADESSVTAADAPADLAPPPITSPVDPRVAWVRRILAVLVAAMGVVDLMSALLSHPPERLVALKRLVPIDVLDTSRTFTLMAGALLIITAWGLTRGKRRAYVAALLLCAVSVPVNLLKAIDFEEATSAAALMFVLGVNAEAFRVRSHAMSLRGISVRAIVFAVLLALYAFVGCWWVADRFSGGAHLGAVARTAADRLLGLGDGPITLRADLTLAQRRVATWFLQSLSVLGITLVLGFALAALRPVAYRRRHVRDSKRVAEIIHEHGDSSVSWFALEPDVDYFFSSNRRAVIAYHYESGVLLGVGDPMGPEEEMPELLGAFARDCASHDWPFAFFQARPERLPLYRRLGWRAVHIGEDPVIVPDQFTLEGAAMGEVRRSTGRLERDGMVARMFVPDVNPFDAHDDPDGLYGQMREISAEWARHRVGGERGFCAGRFDTTSFPDVWLAIAWRPATRRVEAFVAWVTVPARKGWALDLMRRRSDAPSGVMDFLVAKSVQAARERGDAMLSLSLSALASVGTPPDEAAGVSAPPIAMASTPAVAARAPMASSPIRLTERPDPTTLAGSDRARTFLAQHLARFYDFAGLFRWKQKFASTYEDRFLVYPDPMALPAVVLALVRAQSEGGLRSYWRRPAAAAAAIMRPAARAAGARARG